jgi:ABC-type multidrug transport system fused ATPase/permease subunit
MIWGYILNRRFIFLAVLLFLLPAFELFFVALFADKLNHYIFGVSQSLAIKNMSFTVNHLIIIGTILYFAKLFYSYVQHKFAFQFTHNLFRDHSHKISAVRQIRQPADYFIDSFTNRLNMVTATILSIMQAMQALIVVVLISCYILYVDFYSSIIAIGILLLFYAFASFVINKRLDANSIKLAILNPQIIEAINFEWRNGAVLALQGMNKHRITNLDTNHEKFSSLIAYNIFLSSNPKVLFEWVVISSILIFINFYRADPSQLSNLIVIIIAAQRILPGMQTIYQSYATYKANRQSIEELYIVFKADEIEKIEFIQIPFNVKKLEIIEVESNWNSEVIIYAGLKFALDEQYRIIGPSGSGKTVLIDILSGQKTFRGKIKIDEKVYTVKNGALKWAESLSVYKPTQSLYGKNTLFNLGLDDKINSSISSWIQQLNIEDVLTKDASTLSLGQLQRMLILRSISIPARAYFLDEPTNALDRQNSDQLVRLITNMTKNKFTVITSHDASFVQFQTINIEDYRL